MSLRLFSTLPNHPASEPITISPRGKHDVSVGGFDCALSHFFCDHLDRVAQTASKGGADGLFLGLDPAAREAKTRARSIECEKVLHRNEGKPMRNITYGLFGAT